MTRAGCCETVSGGAAAGRAAGGLELRADELVEFRDAVAMGDRDVAAVGLCPTQAELVAVVAEDRPDVSGLVREEVAGIAVGRDAPTRKLRLEGIGRPAAIRMDQPAKERLWGLVEKDPLPFAKHDGAVVLSTRSVLREHVGPVGVGRVDVDACGVRVTPHVDAQAFDETFQSGDALVNDPGVLTPKRDGDVRIAALRICEAAVAEVEAENVPVDRRIGREPSRRRGPWSCHERMFA